MAGGLATRAKETAGGLMAGFFGGGQGGSSELVKAPTGAISKNGDLYNLSQTEMYLNMGSNATLQALDETGLHDLESMVATSAEAKDKAANDAKSASQIRANIEKQARHETKTVLERNRAAQTVMREQTKQVYSGIQTLGVQNSEMSKMQTRVKSFEGRSKEMEEKMKSFRYQAKEKLRSAKAA